MGNLGKFKHSKSSSCSWVISLLINSVVMGATYYFINEFHFQVVTLSPILAGSQSNVCSTKSLVHSSKATFYAG